MKREELIKYFQCRLSQSEEEELLEWVERSPENREEFEQIGLMFNAAVLHGDQKVSPKRGVVLRRVITWTAVAAAMVCGVLLGGYYYGEHQADLFAGKMLSLNVPMGERVDLTLSDGTSVVLRPGTTFRYPTAFRKGERKVYVDGEAIFDVTHDEERPFVVGTHACDVEVLGTSFDVSAEQQTGSFSTSLLRGKVLVTNHADKEQIVMAPGETVTLVDGKIVKSLTTDEGEALLWKDGIVSLRCESFGELMARFEKSFGVNIEVEDGFNPPLNTKGKIRISEGVVHSLEILKRYVSFHYEYDRNENLIRVRR